MTRKWPGEGAFTLYIQVLSLCSHLSESMEQARLGEVELALFPMGPDGKETRDELIVIIILGLQNCSPN